MNLLKEIQWERLQWETWVYTKLQLLRGCRRHGDNRDLPGEVRDNRRHLDTLVLQPEDWGLSADQPIQMYRRRQWENPVCPTSLVSALVHLDPLPEGDIRTHFVYNHTNKKTCSYNTFQSFRSRLLDNDFRFLDRCDPLLPISCNCR